jgi:hypothetical protein
MCAGERDDVSAQNPAKVKELLALLDPYIASAVTPLNELASERAADPASNPKLHGGVWGPWA